MTPEERAELDKWIGEPDRPADYAEIILNRAQVKRTKRAHLRPVIEAGIREAIREAVDAERRACAEIARGVHSSPGEYVMVPKKDDPPSWIHGYSQAKVNIATAIEARSNASPGTT